MVNKNEMNKTFTKSFIFKICQNLGGFVLGVFVLRVFVLGGFVSGGFVLGGFVWKVLSWGVLSWGVLSGSPKKEFRLKFYRMSFASHSIDICKKNGYLTNIDTVWSEWHAIKLESEFFLGYFPAKKKLLQKCK